LTGLLCDWGGTALAFYVAGVAGLAMIAGGYLYLNAHPPQPSPKTGGVPALPSPSAA